MLELLLVIVLVGVLGFVGYRVYQARQVKPTQQSTSPTRTEPEVKTHKLKYEKYSIKYPLDFTLKDTSQAGDANSVPDSDSISLTRKNGFELSIQTGLYGIGGACETCKVVMSKPFTFLGKKVYANFVDADFANGRSSGRVRSIVVTADPTDWFGAGILGKNISPPDGDELNEDLPMGIYMNYADGDEVVEKTLSEMASSKDVAAAIKILESAKY